MEIKDHPQNYLFRLDKVLASIDRAKLATLIEKIASFSKTDHTIFIAGNGGSAGTASHMACDLGKTILIDSLGERPYRLRAISLTDNVPLLTALSNDYGNEYIFSEQLKSFGREGDMLIVLTGSGNSPNIIQAVLAAKAMGIHTYGLLGFGGGKIREILDDMLLIDSDDYGPVEDAHMVINHLITDWFRNQNRGAS
ncbi:MAG: SIS domain-containing protein [Candidatus Doudnabacteria bacterium]|nr:SIS domain-containing protein [Candidatus Doudnabacteria bacterium]